MHIRNFKGKIVYINEKNYSSERDLYIYIWKVKYNINIAKKHNLTSLINYINGDNLFV